MKFTEFLDKEWVIACGCTEPAAIAYAVSKACEQVDGDIQEVKLLVDPRMYKNCYAVGIPHSDHKTGIFWATALGVFLNVGDQPLALFEQINPDILQKAEKLIDSKRVKVDVDETKPTLYINACVSTVQDEARVVIEKSHTNITSIEKNNEVLFEGKAEENNGSQGMRKYLSELSLKELIDIAKSITEEDRVRLREGVEINLKIAKHGLSLFPKKFVEMGSRDSLTEISQMVCAGVYARMCGENFPVMSLAGSGNKGIVSAVPIYMWGKEINAPQENIDEALALTCLVTSLSTHHLGALSAVCGCSNAAGMGLACGMVYLGKGNEEDLSRAITNMVGNVTGMICDGAKIGCALKTMTAVDAAFRASSLALNGIGIPYADGIVDKDGIGSLKNMGRIANEGMIYTDKSILTIMGEKAK